MKRAGKTAITVTLVIVVFLAIAGWVLLAQQAPQGEEGPWGGVDVNVIEKYAADAGREVQEPLINTDKGDLLLFVFALGGAAAGFAAGYCWRMLISDKVERG